MRTPRLTRQTAIGIALACGGLAAILIVVYLRGAKPEEPKAPPPDVELVVPAADIPAKTVVSSQMLTTKKVKPTDVPKGAVRDPKDIVGLVAVAVLPANSPIKRSQLMSKGAAGLSGIVPAGMRAVTVAVDPIAGVGGLLKAGDRVDVIATYEVDDDAVATTLLQDVELLALGGQTVATTRRQEKTRAADEADAAKQSKAKGAKAGAGGDAPTAEAESEAAGPVEPEAEDYAHATLAVSPDEAVKLMLAKDRARLSLALRPVGEQDVVAVPAQKLGYVAGPAYQQLRKKIEAEKAQAGAAQPAAAPTPTPPAVAPAPATTPAAPPAPTAREPVTTKPEPPAVEVIRGSDRQELVP